MWVTKYRYQVLRGDVAERARDVLRQVCLSRDIEIVKGHISVDHIHMLVCCPPLLSPAKLVQFLKGVSSRKLQEEFPHLKKRYWGQHLWARGYFCTTVGTITQDQIKLYIEKHKSEPPDENFGMTLSAPLQSA